MGIGKTEYCWRAILSATRAELYPTQRPDQSKNDQLVGRKLFGNQNRSFRALSKNGSLYIVIKKKHGANSSEKYLRQIFRDVTLKKKKNGYYIYKAIK